MDSKKEIIALVEKLISLPSYEKEKPVSDFIKEYLRDSEYELVEQEVAPGRVNLFFHSGEPQVVFCSHTDTVAPGVWKRDPLQALVEKDTITGLGSVDMKAGLAILLYLAKTHAKAGVAFLFDVDEERDFKGIKHFMGHVPKGFRPKLALFPEPTDLTINHAHRGLYAFTVVALGKSAHGANPQLGIDAGLLRDALLEVRERIKEYATETGLQPALNIGYFEAGTLVDGAVDERRLNSVPSYARAGVEIRPTPELHKKGMAFVRACVKDACEARGLQLKEFECTEELAPLGTTLGELRALTEAMEAEGLAIEVNNAGGYTEAGFFYGLGIPAASFGPGPKALAHQPEEHVTIESLMKCYAVYKRVIDRL